MFHSISQSLNSLHSLFLSPYYLGAASMVMGFTLFTTAFLFGSASSAIVVVATHSGVFQHFQKLGAFDLKCTLKKYV